MTNAQLLALKAEMLGDPATLGYGIYLLQGNHRVLVDMLNDESLGGASIALRSISADVVRCTIVPAEYGALSASERTYLNFLLGGETMHATSVVKNWFQGLGASFATSRQAIVALFTRPASRAQLVLNDEDARVTLQNVVDALNA